jgi:hypothetical protein
MTNKNERDLITLEPFGASFRLPERIGVENALNYWSMVSVSYQSKNRLVKIWEAALECDLLRDWECERFPDPSVPLEDVPAEDEMFVAQLIISVANRVQAFMSETRSVEKN